MALMITIWTKSIWTKSSLRMRQRVRWEGCGKSEGETYVRVSELVMRRRRGIARRRCVGERDATAWPMSEAVPLCLQQNPSAFQAYIWGESERQSAERVAEGVQDWDCGKRLTPQILFPSHLPRSPASVISPPLIIRSSKFPSSLPPL